MRRRGWLPLVMAAMLATALGVDVAAAQDLERATEERSAVESDLDEVVAELEGVAARIGEAEREKEHLEREVRQLHDEAQRAERVLAEQARQAYLDRPAQGVELLLGSELAEARERARLLDSIGRYRSETIEQATAARTAFAQRQAALDEVLAELSENYDRVAELRAELDETFRVLRERELDLVSRRDRQRRVSRTGQEGVYACPLAVPHHFRDTWGAPRSGGRRHRGVDIFAPMAADVYAITNGEIVRHSHSRLGGIGLHIAGDDGNQYYYAHLLEILPDYEPGTRVEAGELVARNGATGNADAYAPHVHMEVRPGGGPPANPYPFAAAACR